MSEAFADAMSRLEGLLARVEATCPKETLPLVRELVRALLEAHHGGLETLLAALRARAVDTRALAEDPAIGSLLLMHDLHPGGPLPEEARGPDRGLVPAERIVPANRARASGGGAG